MGACTRLCKKQRSGCACGYPKGTPGGGCGALRVAPGLGDTAGEPCASPVPLGEREKEGQRQLAVRHPLFHEDFSGSDGVARPPWGCPRALSAFMVGAERGRGWQEQLSARDVGDGGSKVLEQLGAGAAGGPHRPWVPAPRAARLPPGVLRPPPAPSPISPSWDGVGGPTLRAQNQDASEKELLVLSMGGSQPMARGTQLGARPFL